MNESAKDRSESVEVRVPKLPESVSDATLVSWHKAPGDTVRRDENLVDVETDKVVFEVPAPVDGVVTEIRKQEGDTVVGDETIAVLSAGEASQAEPASEQASPRAPADELALSPAVRRLVDEHRLDPAQIPATGKNGRLTKADVLNFLDHGKAAAQQPQPQPAEIPETGEAAPPSEAPSTQAEEPEAGLRRVPMSRLRKRIADRMVEAQQTAAILTTFNEVNLKAVMELRQRYRDAFQERHGIKLGFMSFFVKASIEALRRLPIVNASVEGDEILYHDYYDIGIAVSSPRGLVVPVLRDADKLGFADIEAAIGDYAKRAHSGELTMDELTGGTFTITNGGVFGSLLSTPILNPPQSAILGMHKIEERPVVEGGEIVVRPMMYVALSYDHRIIDGRDAVQFLVAVKDLIEDPTRLLIEV